MQPRKWERFKRRLPGILGTIALIAAIFGIGAYLGGKVADHHSLRTSHAYRTAKLPGYREYFQKMRSNGIPSGHVFIGYKYGELTPAELRLLSAVANKTFPGQKLSTDHLRRVVESIQNMRFSAGDKPHPEIERQLNNWEGSAKSAHAYGREYEQRVKNNVKLYKALLEHVCEAELFEAGAKGAKKPEFDIGNIRGLLEKLQTPHTRLKRIWDGVNYGPDGEPKSDLFHPAGKPAAYRQREAVQRSRETAKFSGYNRRMIS